MRKNKKSIKVISVVLTMLILLGVLPMSALAANINISDMSDAVIQRSTEDTPDIVAEVKEKRDEFSKTYLLEDGSYYSITTYSPIHEEVNGEWETINESLDIFSKDVNVVEANLQEASIEMLQESDVSLLSDTPAVDISSSLEVNPFDCTVDANGVVTFNNRATILARPETLNYYFNDNKIVVEAKLAVECSTTTGHRKSKVELYESEIAWDESMTTAPTVTGYPKMDYIDIVSAGTYYWDITDLYSRWDREATANNGFFLRSSSTNCELSLTSMCISVRYKNIDENDLDSTYHTVDMGRAGKVYINDITNTVKVEQNILTIDRAAFPISLKRIYNLSKAMEENSAGKGFRWSYESKVAFDGDLVTWQMFDGTVRCYVNSNTVSGDYTKFVETGKVAAMDLNDSVMWIKTTELSNETYNYSNFYAEISDETYNFDSTGNLIKLQVGENTANAINYNYVSGKLNNITYNDINNSVSTITIMSTGTDACNVLFASYGTNGTTQLVNITSTTDSSTGVTTNRVTYSADEWVDYKFNSNNELLEIVDVDGSKLKLYYFDDDYTVTGNRLESYERFVNNGTTDELVESLTFDTTKTYQRKITNNESQTEFIQYDKNFNVITYKGFDGDYTFATYDENNVLKSYTVGEDVVGEKVTEGDFSDYGDNWDYEITEIIETTEIENNDLVVCPFDSQNEFVAKISSNSSFVESLYQETQTSLTATKTYVFGAWVYIDEALPNGKSDISVNIKEYVKEEIIESVKFANTVTGEWQYQLAAFKVNINTPVIISIDYCDENGDDGAPATIYVDNVTLYESSIAQTDIVTSITDSGYQVTRNDNGTVDSEIFTDGITSMIKSYEYDSNYVSSITDINGLTKYYKYNTLGRLEEIGTIKSGNDIIDPTEFGYNSSNLCLTIDKIITNISTGNPVTLSSEYDYDRKNRIVSIMHNDVYYDFVYTGDKITSVDEFSNDETTISVPTIKYEYNDDCLGEINYANGLKVTYTYTDGEISSVKYYQNGTDLTKEITYSTNTAGYMVVTDTGSGYEIEHTATGYKMYKNNADNSKTLMYVLEKNADGSTTETYMPDLYKVGDEHKVVITTGATTTTNNPQTGETVDTTSLSFEKVYNWENESDFEARNNYLERVNVKDYFKRVTQRSIELTDSTNYENGIKISESFSYKDLGNNVTSSLVSSHSTNINTVDSSNVTASVFSNERFYEYDHNGNIIFEYEMNNGTPNIKKYYEYDEAQQIIGEINFEREIAVTYTYDAGGNLTSKVNHNFTEAASNITTAFNAGYATENRTFNIAEGSAKYGVVTSTTSLGYDSIWKNRLTNYNGTAISYDEFGNPLNYTGTTFFNKPIGATSVSENTISASLEWSGNKLSALETDDIKYEYEYDENGYRTRKLDYDRELNESNEYVWKLAKETTYIWNNGVLISIIADSFDGAPWQSDLIYDEDGNIAGFVSNMGAVAYYVKDINNSVKNIVLADGTVMMSIAYDSWGVPSLIFNTDDSAQGNISTIVYALIFALNPCTYNGYLFDHETGLYFFKDRVYSPSWGRYLNMDEFSSLLEETETPLSHNLYVFSNNNPVNFIAPYSILSDSNYGLEWNADGFEIDTNEVFLSRIFCTLFANQLVKANGTFDYNNGFTYNGMDVNDIAQSLFAHNVGRYASSAVNKMNAVWGDGWMDGSDRFIVSPSDINSAIYEKIWFAASDIRTYAWSQGIYITI